MDHWNINYVVHFTFITMRNGLHRIRTQCVNEHRSGLSITIEEAARGSVLSQNSKNLQFMDEI
jgi:hypothetical protein